MALLGNPGRPAVARPAPDFDSPEDGSPVKTGVALPPGCFRVLHDPIGRFECQVNCPGLQRDHSCLCDIVRKCSEQGVEPEFEIDHDGYWIYSGPQLFINCSSCHRSSWFRLIDGEAQQPCPHCGENVLMLGRPQR